MLVCRGAFYQIFLVFLFLILHPSLSWQKRPYMLSEVYIKTKNLKCDFEQDWIANASCKLKPISWERTDTYVKVDLLQPLKNLSVHIQYFRLETQYIPFLINIRVNVCDLLQKKGIDFYSRILFKFVNRFVNIKNIICPLAGHMELNGAYLKGSDVIIPPGTYKAICTCFEGYPPERVGVLTVFLDVIEKHRSFQ